MDIDYSKLPAIDEAKLPDSYQSAVRAMQSCASIDEVKEWSDKAAAIASYARMASDDELFKKATRIKARAIRRCGELLKAIESASNQYDAQKNAKEGAHPSRKQAAVDAGLSEHQHKQAIRVANVPDKDFEDLVESEDPPTVTALSDIGRRPQEVNRHPAFHLATRCGGGIGRLHEFCEVNNPNFVADGFLDHEVDGVIAKAEYLARWLYHLSDALKKKHYSHLGESQFQIFGEDE